MISSRLKLFCLSFLSLFLELMFIRWTPSVFHLIAYYANLMLISSFLGLGLGILTAPRFSKRRSLFPLFLLFYILLLIAVQHVSVPNAATEARFFVMSTRWMNYLALMAVFLFNALLFLPLGNQIGKLFDEISPLQAYAWDLGGSLCGTAVFGLFSFYYFSPIAGIFAMMVLFLIVTPTTERRLAAVLFALGGMAILALHTPAARWSPYYYITINSSQGLATDVNVSAPADLLRMTNPPFYNIHVNQDFYQAHGTIDESRYHPIPPFLPELRSPRVFPFTLHPHAKHVLICGAGGGVDAEAALLSGAEHVDAVEIDPVIVDISRHFNASGVYNDPRVTVFLQDARVFLQQTMQTYDVIAFGKLDSQALFSSMANLRLDGYIYTVESFRAAYRRLADGGLLTVSFSIPRVWIASKLFLMLQEASGMTPAAYSDGTNWIFCVTRNSPLIFPAQVGGLRRLEPRPDAVPLAQDDWPYLYLSKRTIPPDYFIVMGTLLAISLALLVAVRPKRFERSDFHFFFMGLAFLLLETKSIIDCSLYFGATWLVTTIVTAGILLMLLASNAFAQRLKKFSPLLYLPLLFCVLILVCMPKNIILAQPFPVRLLWTLLAVPLPVFFAGLIFSTTFKQSRSPSASLGANLIGATFGGFLEYLGMVVGYQTLFFVILVAYLASFCCIYDE